jgi:tetratricopeptide (TPR) repeat protein
LLALALVAFTPAIAHAQRASGRATGASVRAPGVSQNLLDLGRQQYEDLRYEEAIQTLSAAIIRRGNAREAEIQIYELLALSYLALNRNDEAEGAFRLMLARDPEHQLSTDLAPRTVEFFNAVKQRWVTEGQPGLPRQGETAPPPPAAVTIEHRSPAQQQRNHEVALTVVLTDPGSRVAKLVLAYRQGSQGLFHRTDALRVSGGTFHATIPASSVRPPLVEYYLEAVDRAGVPIQSRGDAYAPLRVAVPESGGVPWGVVGIVGGVVVVGAVITIIAVASATAPGHLDIRAVPEQ